MQQLRAEPRTVSCLFCAPDRQNPLPTSTATIQRRCVPVEPRHVEAVIAAEGDAAAELLQLLYAFINSDAYARSLCLDGAGDGGEAVASPEQAAVVAAEQRAFYQQQQAAARSMSPASKQRHMGALCEAKKGERDEKCVKQLE